SLQRAKADADDAQAGLNRSQQDTDSARVALDAADQAVADAQSNYDSASSYASYARSSMETDFASRQQFKYCPPPPQQVVVVEQGPEPAPFPTPQPPAAPVVLEYAPPRPQRHAPVGVNGKPVYRLPPAPLTPRDGNDPGSRAGRPIENRDHRQVERDARF